MSAAAMPIIPQVDAQTDAQPHLQPREHDFPLIKPRQPGPNMWTVLQKWIRALPSASEDQRQRRLRLQKELERVASEFDDGKGLGEDGVRSPDSSPPLPP